MPVTSLGAAWEGGNLVFKNSSGAIIAAFGAPTAVTASSTGEEIPDYAASVDVTSASANNIVILPTPTPGREIRIHVGANGCELRSSAPSTISINGGSGAAAESALAANSTVVAYCVSATAWRALEIASDGTTSGVEAAA